jgi:hypothetical protein
LARCGSRAAILAIHCPDNSGVTVNSIRAARLTKAVVLEFAKQGIRVNSVAPGFITTDMVDPLLGKEGDRRNWLLSQHPAGRLGASEEIAGAVLYLASDAAKFTRHDAVGRRRMGPLSNRTRRLQGWPHSGAISGLRKNHLKESRFRQDIGWQVI